MAGLVRICCLFCCLVLMAPVSVTGATGLTGQQGDDFPPLRAEVPCSDTTLLSPEGQFAQARAAAWLVALQQAAGLLPQLQGRAAVLSSLAGLGALPGGGGLSQGIALAACVYTVEDATYSHTGGKLAVQVRLVPDGQPGERLALCLREAAFPALYALLAAESREALQVLDILHPGADSSAPPTAGVSPANGAGDSRAEADRLARRLEGLWLGLMALELSPEGWYGGPTALPALEQAAQLAPDSPVVQLLLGEALLRQGLPQQCVEVCNAALRLNGSLAHALYVRGLAHWRLQHLALAESDLDAAIELARASEAPGSGMAQRQGELAQQSVGLTRCLRARGAVRLLRGNTAGMCADLRAACAQGDCTALAGARQQGQCGGTATGGQP